MRKEVVAAILLGSFIGLTTAFGVWKISKPKDTKTQTPVASGLEKTLTPKASPTPIPAPKEKSEINISKPTKDYEIVSADKTIISGTTAAKSYVAIVVEGKTYILFTNDNGSFEDEVELKEGSNQIEIFVFKEDRIEKTRTHILHVKDAKNNGFELYKGSITDITESTLQIKDEKSGIKQISLAKETTYQNIQKTPKPIQQKDVAIGDFIFAFGTIKAKDTISAQYVFVATEPKNNDTSALFGKVTKVAKSNTTLSLQVQDKTYTIDNKEKPTVLTAKKDGTIISSRLSNIEVDDTLIVTGQESQDTLTSKTIFILPPSNN